MFRSILFSVALSCLVYSAIALNNETDRLTLLNFKAKTNDPLGILSSWNNTLHFCNWYGVTCGRMHQRVSALNLSSSHLSGSVSPYIEYGMGNEVSACGDVYSFGILVLEMFTGKRPTDDIFIQGISLHEYVKAALSEQDIKIVDDALLHDMAVDNSNSQIIFQSVVSVLEIALSCSAELPQDRPDMSTVAAKLSLIRNKLQ